VRLAETEAPLLRLGVCGPAGVVDVAAGAGGGWLCVDQPSRLKASTNCHVLVVPALLVSLMLAVSTGGALLSGVGLPTLAALLTALAVCTVYVEPATMIAVPDEELLDLDRVPVTDPHRPYTPPVSEVPRCR